MFAANWVEFVGVEQRMMMRFLCSCRGQRPVFSYRSVSEVIYCCIGEMRAWKGGVVMFAILVSDIGVLKRCEVAVFRDSETRECPLCRM